jgi:hypothetical protein
MCFWGPARARSPAVGPSLCAPERKRDALPLRWRAIDYSSSPALADIIGAGREATVAITSSAPIP